MNAHLSILYVDDEPDHALILKRCLGSMPGVSCEVTHVLSIELALLRIDRHQYFDAVFVDYQLSAGTAVDLIRILRERNDFRPVVVLTAHGDEYVAVQMIRAGAYDYIAKSDLTSPRLGLLIQGVCDKLRSMEKDQGKASQMRDSLATLTPKERQVMGLMVRGMTTQEIASRLARSQNTIKIHRSRVLQKMHARTPTELANRVLWSQHPEKWEHENEGMDHLQAGAT